MTQPNEGSGEENERERKKRGPVRHFRLSRDIHVFIHACVYHIYYYCYILLCKYKKKEEKYEWRTTRAKLDIQLGIKVVVSRELEEGG